MRFPLAALALVLLGCSDPEPVFRVELSEAVTAVEAAEIAAAVRDWEQFVPVNLHAAPDDEDAIPLIMTPVVTERDASTACPLEGLAGKMCPSTTRAWIYYRREHFSRRLILHELGHAMGLPHLDVPSAMGGLAPGLTEADRDAWYTRRNRSAWE